MKTKIQIVKNPDRFHVTANNIPVFTFLFGRGISKEFAYMNATSQAYLYALEQKKQGFKVELFKDVEK